MEIVPDTTSSLSSDAQMVPLVLDDGDAAQHCKRDHHRETGIRHYSNNNGATNPNIIRDGDTSGRGLFNSCRPSGNANSTIVSNTNSTAPQSNSVCSVRQDREREGRCGDCGAQTHAVIYERKTRVYRKEPLNVENEVHRGRCLLCHPMPARTVTASRQLQNEQPEDQSRPPRFLWHSTSQNLSNEEQSSVNSGSLYSSNSRLSGPSFCWSGSKSVADSRPRSHAYHPYFRHSRNLVRGSAQGSQTSRSVARGHDMESSNSPSNNEELPALQESVNNSQQDFPARSKVLSRIVALETKSMSDSNHTKNSGSDARNQVVDPIPNETPDETEEDICSLLSLMRQKPHHAPTISRNLHSLWVLSWENENAAAIGQVGGIPTILSAMRLHPHSITVQSNAISTLQNLASVSEFIRDALAEDRKGVRGTACIVESMARFLDNGEIQQSGCMALSNIIGSGSGSCWRKKCVADAGGELAVVRAVEGHPEEESVVRAAYRLSRKLKFNPGTSRDWMVERFGTRGTQGGHSGT